MSNPTILVTGATGKQGGSLIRALQGKPVSIRAMTRQPDGETGRALSAQGVQVVKGDLDDEASLHDALRGAWAAFAVQNTWEAGVEKEEAQGKRIAQAAKAAGVQHFVYSSVGSAHLETGIPHFENKSRVEETVRSLGFPTFAILRPVFFMENLVSPWFLNGDVLATAMKPTTKLQMIAADDIGRFAAQLVLDPKRFNGRAVDVAGDARTMPEAAAILSRALGRQINFVELPMDMIRKNSEDFALMLEWFERVGYSADIKSLEAEFGFTPLTLDAWARTIGKS
jgi:uncharacterized protein YbjT (DUF2867 family)